MTADRVDPGYPRLISDAWNGVFASGISAVLYAGGRVTPVRLLSAAQANGLVVDLVARGKLGLRNPGSPPAGQNVVIQPATVAGVRYTNPAAPATDVIDNLDQRMVVALTRLAGWMNASEPTVTEITHLGIGHGNGPADDCNNQGRAIDFAGVNGTSNGAAFGKVIQPTGIPTTPPRRWSGRLAAIPPTCSSSPIPSGSMRSACT